MNKTIKSIASSFLTGLLVISIYIVLPTQDGEYFDFGEWMVKFLAWGFLSSVALISHLIIKRDALGRKHDG